MEITERNRIVGYERCIHDLWGRSLEAPHKLCYREEPKWHCGGLTIWDTLRHARRGPCITILHMHLNIPISEVASTAEMMSCQRGVCLWARARKIQGPGTNVMRNRDMKRNMSKGCSSENMSRPSEWNVPQDPSAHNAGHTQHVRCIPWPRGGYLPKY